MTAFTASRAPETTADNNDFGGEGVETLSTSRLHGPPSVGWFFSKHKRISPRPFEREEGTGRIELVLSGHHRPATMTVAFPAREGRLYWNLTISRDCISQKGIKG